MKKIAEFIVKFRKLFLVLFLAFGAYCVYGMTQTKIEYDVSTYLSETTDTKKALGIMDKEFYTFGSTTIMVKNVSYFEADELHNEILDVKGVKELPFYNTEDYYKDGCALFSITYEGTEDDEITLNAYNKTKEILANYDYYVKNDLSDNYADTLQTSINFVLLIAVGIIIVVLTITSESFMEVPVFLATFGMAALMNMGTNYWLGTISFVSNSVCSILQLALAIDYAIILANRFQEEKAFSRNNSVEAMTSALSKAIPEIGGSSLTTIAGMAALTTMSFKLGGDLGFALIKSILFSMVSVFFIMPALLLLFDKPITKTMHKSLVPKISWLGKFDVKVKYVMPVLFLVLAGVSCYYSFQVDYCYGQNTIDTDHPSNAMIAEREIANVFGNSSQFVIVLPGNDYEAQYDILNMVSEEPMIKSATGIANVEITQNDITYRLPEKMNYRQFSEFLNTDDSTGDAIYSSYAFLSKEDAKDAAEEVMIYQANKLNYKVSLLELADTAFAHDDFIQSLLADDADALSNYADIKCQIQDAEKQLIGEHYSRLVFEIDGADESIETFALIERLQSKVKAKYSDAIFAGDAMANYDLSASFSLDNTKVTVFTILFVYVILLFTFKNWAIPIPLVFTIQSAVFINFAYFVLVGSNCYFFVNLIVSAIQMGATIDYAIVITNRYLDLRKTYEDRGKAMVESLNQAFPTILTSGTILVSASFLIGVMVSDPLISTLGSCLCRGCLISIACAMIVMPSMLLLSDKFIDKADLEEKLNFFSRELNAPMNKIKGKVKAIDLALDAKVAEASNKDKEGESK